MAQCWHPDKPCEYRINTYERKSPYEGQCRLTRRKKILPCPWDVKDIVQDGVDLWGDPIHISGYQRALEISRDKMKSRRRKCV